MYTLGDRARRRCLWVGCHTTSLLAGNSGLRQQWPARPSRSFLIKLEGRRGVCVGDSVSPTGVMDTAEHGGIWSIGRLYHSDSKWPPFAAIKQNTIVAWKSRILRSLKRLDDQILDVSLSAYQARLFLTLMSFSEELTLKSRYLKSETSSKIWPCRERRGGWLSTLHVSTLVFLSLSTSPMSLHSISTRSNEVFARETVFDSRALLYACKGGRPGEHTVCCPVSGRYQYPDTWNENSIFEAPFSVLGKRSISNESWTFQL